MWSNKGKGVHENHPQNNSCMRTTAGIRIASFSLTEQVPVACSHFHNCPIYLSQLFSPQIPFSLGSQLKKSVCVVKDIILVQDLWVEKIVWLGWNAEISILELLRKWSWPLSLFLSCPALVAAIKVSDLHRRKWVHQNTLSKILTCPYSKGFSRISTGHNTWSFSRGA